ncbi:MAG: aminoglycoside phosphotransferase family protein [Pseudomonadota bacterium]|nr:aminoglycoside phosphotransferase family protein [Pseudomonadota bacterium]
MIPIDFICQQFGLGQAITSPIALKGGLIHEMWHITTTSGQFAIKRVNQHNIRLLANTIMPIQPAESLALHYQQRGLLARVACQTLTADWSVMSDNQQCWMVFPWIEGHIKSSEAISQNDACRVGTLLARLHQESVSLINLTLPDWFGFEPTHWQQLLSQATKKNMPWATFATTHSADLHYWSERARTMKSAFTETLLVSHRDVSMSNIVWREDGEPVLIDWEYAGLVNPASDVFNTAMTWSDQKNITIFNAIVTAANHNFQMDDERLLSGYAGYLLEWCEFNMQRSLIDPDITTIASGEVKNVITVLTRLNGRGDKS